MKNLIKNLTVEEIKSIPLHYLSSQLNSEFDEDINYFYLNEDKNIAKINTKHKLFHPFHKPIIKIEISKND